MDLTDYGIQLRPPALPEPPEVYNVTAWAQFINVLRIYFNGLDGVLRQLASEARPTVFEVDADTTLEPISYQLLICTNTSPITLTVNDTPTTRDVLIVKAAGTGQVTIDGNGKNIDGNSTLILTTQYSAPNLVFTTAAGEWSTF
ncbi:MAG TPA: hypothetical protein VKP88_00985 [Candidatus Paceibacterota bacterium]|nr:hypothetical protein [Candidatus Paceibacterota bacterium]